MTKIRNFIEKIWWVIPPIVAVSTLPFLLAVKDTLQFSQPLSAFFLNFFKYLYLIPDFFTGTLPSCQICGIIFMLIPLGFMGIGYYLVRKNPLLFLRIIVPIILTGIGFFLSLFVFAMLGA